MGLSIRLALLLGLAGSLHACTAAVETVAPTLPQRVTLTDHFRVVGWGEGEAAWLEHQYLVLSRRFGFSLSPGQRVTFNASKGTYDGPGVPRVCPAPYCRNGDGFEVSCDPITETDCAVRLARIYADLMGVGVPLLRAGLSEVLAGGMTFADMGVAQSDRTTPLERRIFAETCEIDDCSDPVLRATAADFVRFLIDRLGPSEFARFYRDWDGTSRGWAEQLGGESPVETVAKWRATPSYAGRRFAWNAPECELPPLPAAGDGTWELKEINPDGIPIHFAGYLWLHRPQIHPFSLVLDADANVSLDWDVVHYDGDSQEVVRFPAFVSVESCAGPAGPAPLLAPPEWGFRFGSVSLEGPHVHQLTGQLPAGRYAIYVVRATTLMDLPNVDINVHVSARPLGSRPLVPEEEE